MFSYIVERMILGACGKLLLLPSKESFSSEDIRAAATLYWRTN